MSVTTAARTWLARGPRAALRPRSLACLLAGHAGDRRERCEREARVVLDLRGPAGPQAHPAMETLI